MSTGPNAKVAAYEAFASRLLADLDAIEAARDADVAKATAYRELAESVALRAAQCADGGPSRLLVDIGAEVLCQADAAADALCYVDVGLGFRLGMTADEVAAFCPKKAEILDDAVRRRNEEAAQVRAHLKLITEGIRELSGIAAEPAGATTHERRGEY